MKRLFFSLGLSVTILLSAAFAQPAAKKIAAPLASAKATMSVKKQQTEPVNPKLMERFAQVRKTSVPASSAVVKKNAKASLRHMATYKSGDSDKATVKLVVDGMLEDESGFQVLLYKDSRMADTLTLDDYDEIANVGNIRHYYDVATAKIPEDATSVANWVIDDEAETSVDGGIYDAIVVNPYDYAGEMSYWVITNSVLNDFEFENGCTYVFGLEIIDGESVASSFLMPFDLKVEELVLPMSCEVGNEVEIKLAVTNNGTVDVENFELWYCVDPEADSEAEPDTVKQSVSAKLEAGQTETYTFTAKLEQIRENSLYEIHAGVTPFSSEVNVADNTVAGCFVKQEGMTELPYAFDLDHYGMIPSNSEAWGFEDGIALNDFEPNSPLVSRCFDLKGGKAYRLSYDYIAGFDFLGIFQIPEDYHIGFGLESEPVSEWEVVLEEEEVFAADWVRKDVLLKPEEDGTYAFCFTADDLGYLMLQNISVTEVADYDARLNAFYTGLAPVMPLKQVNGTFTAALTVQNRGLRTMDEATVEVKMNGTVVGSATVKNIGLDSIVDVLVPLTVNGLKVGDRPKFVAAVSLADEAETERTDNQMEQEVEVSAYVMAYDNQSYQDAIGGNGYSLAIGNLFTLGVKDTLTSVSLGWYEYEEMNVGIRIQKWNPTTRTLDATVYETEVRRGTAAGLREYKIPSIILEAGTYMVSAVQFGTTNFALLVDDNEAGVFYVMDEDMVIEQPGYGYPVIRVAFGPDAKPMAKDILVSEIKKPKETGMFAVNQEVLAVVSNQGYEAAQVPIFLSVNGQIKATNTVDLAAYGRQEVSFIADLSASNTEYVIKVFSALEGDADPTNDTCTKIVHSLAPADPYVMNFEYCEDFATEGFNPLWKTVDVDGNETYGFNGLTFPNMGGAFAFIAFNPGEVGANGMEPHGGDRFGASFAAAGGLNNDWLISPKLKIIAGKEYMEFFVQTYVDDYGLEKYNVLVSTTDDKPESFVKIGNTRQAPAEEWEKVSVDLKEYSGKEVYLAIQCVSEDAFIFMIDDITVCTKVANEAVAEDIATRLSVYPNPATEMITIHAQDAVINQVAVFNVSGMMVYQSDNLNTTDYRYSVKGLNAGIYFARVTTEQGTAVMKFVVR